MDGNQSIETANGGAATLQFLLSRRSVGQLADPAPTASELAAGIGEDRMGLAVAPRARPQWHHAIHQADEPAGCLADDPPTRRGGPCGGDRMPHVASDRDHRLLSQRRRARSGTGNGREREPADDQALRPTKERLTQDEVERIRL